METIKSYGIRAAAERLGIQPTALIKIAGVFGLDKQRQPRPRHKPSHRKQQHDTA